MITKRVVAFVALISLSLASLLCSLSCRVPESDYLDYSILSKHYAPYFLDDLSGIDGSKTAMDFSNLSKRGSHSMVWLIELHMVGDMSKPYVGKGITDRDFAALENCMQPSDIPFLLCLCRQCNDLGRQMRAADMIQRMTGYDSWKLLSENPHKEDENISIFCKWWIGSLTNAPLKQKPINTSP